MMDPRWNRAKQVFHEALEKTGSQRTSFVAAACGDDAEVRAQVEALLKAHDEAGEFLDSPTGGVDAAAGTAATGLAGLRPPEALGTHVGAYKLLQVIGEGGFGVVYMAEQEQPIRRRVALKVIKLGMDTKEVIARFETERQALAMMDHPNIAKVLDAGTTASGRPYFVMELVKGVPLTSYCDANHVSTRERLELFIQVCKAVQHAHEKGIIHRDIKPSNVMVTLHDAVPIPKIIDFGVAKATNHRLTEKTLFTAYGACIGTPTYMSPEQAEMSGLDVDKRSDVYSLGVLLYELLTGTTPLDPETLRSAAFVELLRIIREEDPPTPSARLSTLGERLTEIARNRHVDPGVLTKTVRGDLDWIVMKAIEKDRRRRYDSATDLVADVGRYLKDEPITARRPSSMYKLGKFAKRQRGPLLAVAAVIVALGLGGLAAFTRSAPGVAATSGLSAFPDLTMDDELLSVSPDGTKAVEMDYRDVKDNLALYDFTSKKRRVLVDTLHVEIDDAVWSPDAQRVAFRVPARPNAASELRVTTLDGQSNVVYRNEDGRVRVVGWTPDGTSLVAVLSRQDNSVSLGTVPASGGRFTSLQPLTSSALGSGACRLSPDGRFVAYETGEVGVRDIQVVSLDGSHSYQITDHPADDFAPVWSPDSRHLAFVSNRGGSVALWAIEVMAGQPAGQPVRLRDGMQAAHIIDWIERGIFFGQRPETSDLYTVALDPAQGSASKAPQQIPYPRSGGNVSPAWSPDGKRLAFVAGSTTEPTRKHVVVMAADGSQAREFLIPTTSYSGTWPPYDLRWFGDGRGLGFSGDDNRWVPTLFRLQLETGEWDTVRLPIKSSWTRIEWNRDGSAFYFVRRSSADGESGIFERSVNGNTERVVYRPTERASIRALQFSPDRKWLAFHQTTGPSDVSIVRIMVVDVATGVSQTVLENTVASGDLNRNINLVSWSPQGDLLIWRPRPDNGPPETLLVPVTGGAPRPITIPMFGPNYRPLMAKWSPTGASLVLVRERRSYQTSLIENPLAAAHPVLASR